MSATEIGDTGIPLPRICEIQALPDFRLAIVWAEGSRRGRTELVDLAPVINTYKVYRPLRNNEELFQTARLVDDGNVVAWGDGRIDMSAELLEDIANETMAPQDFANFLERTALPKKLPLHSWAIADAKSELSLVLVRFRVSSLLHAMGTKCAPARIRNVNPRPRLISTNRLRKRRVRCFCRLRRTSASS